jgi:hypothetical protein
MEIGASTMAAREVSINKRNVENDILQKTLEKTEQSQQEVENKPVEQVSSERQGGIDFYA